jgi:hypothetical protein
VLPAERFDTLNMRGRGCLEMIAAASYELTHDEVLSLIGRKAQAAGRDLHFMLQQYTDGTLEDFGALAEAYALCDLLEGDDSAFQAA